MFPVPMLRRAPAACSWCRYRKVRCDGSILGCPCTRCRQDGRDGCVLRARPKYSRRAWTQSRIPPPELDFPGSALTRAEASTTAEPEADSDGRAPKRREVDLLYAEYPFIDSRVLSRLPPEDETFLAAKGAMSLPDQEATDEFVHQYFKRIHPTVPVIDEAEFWRMYDGLEFGKVSIFVFQAILFASCPFVSLETLRRCGFSNKRDARKQLYNRAKLLYYLQVESSPSAKAQGAVLLTHHTSSEDPLGGSHWLTQAIENAMMIDAKPFFSNVEDVNPSLKKRLWWSILLRDRSLCIGLRRRPQVPVEYCNWMTEEDFADEIQHSRVYNETQKRRLLDALLEQCRLALLLSDLVSLIFSPRVQFPSPLMSAEQFAGLMAMIARIRLALIEWEESSLGQSPREGGTDGDDTVAMLRNLTAMYFHAARVDLAQYAAMTIEENINFAKPNYPLHLQELSHELYHSIEGLTSALEYFSNQGHLESLPLSVLGYVGMPLILTAIDLKLSSTHTEMTARKNRLGALSAIIRHSESLYDVTDPVTVGINHILQLAYLTTKNLFLKRLPNDIAKGLSLLTPRAIRANSSTSTSTNINDNPPPQNTAPTLNSRSTNTPITGPKSRATTWIDAFILWPRAYLLISTTVDHSLSVGSLPSDIALPEVVRHIPAMGAGFRLPWNVGSGHIGFRRRTSDGFAVGGGDGDGWRGRGLLGLGTEVMDHEDESGGQSSSGRNSRSEEEEEEEGPTVNLDYLDLGYAVRVQESLGGGGGGGGSEDVRPAAENDLTIAEDDGDIHRVEGEEQEQEQGIQEAIGDLEYDTALFNALSSELLRVDGVDV